jgi:hypothetical protein
MVSHRNRLLACTCADPSLPIVTPISGHVDPQSSDVDHDAILMERVKRASLNSAADEEAQRRAFSESHQLYQATIQAKTARMALLNEFLRGPQAGPVSGYLTLPPHYERNDGTCLFAAFAVIMGLGRCLEGHSGTLGARGHGRGPGQGGVWFSDSSKLPCKCTAVLLEGLDVAAAELRVRACDVLEFALRVGAIPAELQSLCGSMEGITAMRQHRMYGDVTEAASLATAYGRRLLIVHVTDSNPAHTVVHTITPWVFPSHTPSSADPIIAPAVSANEEPPLVMAFFPAGQHGLKQGGHFVPLMSPDQALLCENHSIAGLLLPQSVQIVPSSWPLAAAVSSTHAHAPSGPAVGTAAGAMPGGSGRLPITAAAGTGVLQQHTPAACDPDHDPKELKRDVHGRVPQTPLRPANARSPSSAAAAVALLATARTPPAMRPHRLESQLIELEASGHGEPPAGAAADDRGRHPFASTPGPTARLGHDQMHGEGYSGLFSAQRERGRDNEERRVSTRICTLRMRAAGTLVQCVTQLTSINATGHAQRIEALRDNPSFQTGDTVKVLLALPRGTGKGKFKRPRLDKTNGVLGIVSRTRTRVRTRICDNANSTRRYSSCAPPS